VNHGWSKPRSVLDTIEHREFRTNFAQKSWPGRLDEKCRKEKKKTYRFGGGVLSGRRAIKLGVVRHAPVENVNATAPLPAA